MPGLAARSAAALLRPAALQTTILQPATPATVSIAMRRICGRPMPASRMDVLVANSLSRLALPGRVILGDRQSLPRQALDFTQHGTFLASAKRHGNSRRTGARRPPDAMHIDFRRHGQI